MRTGVTAPEGWLAAGISCGTKPSGDLDLALVVSEHPSTVAGAFTTNKVVGAPIIVCKPRVAAGRARGVVVSAGVANVATGAAGVEDARRMAAAAAAATGVPEEEMLVSSTGMIGPRLPMSKVEAGIAEVASRVGPDGGEDASRAILTTDTRPKVAVRSVEVGGRSVVVGGMAKGAGMIAPQMAMAHATMLAYLTTDAVAPPERLREILAAGLDATFNAISIDGCMSTSDTALLFANGASGVEVGDSEIFAGAVHEIMAELSYGIVSDGEGASKVVRIRVTGAAGDLDARAVAREVASSVLVRSAVWGGDPNWGRIAQAVGQTRGVELDPDRLRIAIGGVELAVGGLETGRDAEAAQGFADDEVLMEVDLGLGVGTAEMLTCDLTPEYVKFNADYTT